jgi:hypothetical protein
MAGEQTVQVQEVERSASRLESELREQIGRMQASSRTALAVGIILIIVIFVYLTYLTSALKKEMQPDVLVETIESYATAEGLPRLQQAFIEQAPQVAQALRQQAMSWVPVLRQTVENQAMQLTDSLIDRLDASADEVIEKFLADQKTELKPLIDRASEPDAALELEKEFTESLEEIVGQKMDDLLVQYDRGMMFVDSRLSRFQRPTAELTPEEQFEKECVVRLMGFINEASKQAVLDIGPPTTTTPAIAQ